MKAKAIRTQGFPAEDQLDEVCYWYNPTVGSWFIYLPRCGAGRLSEHKVTINQTETITVEPSILMRGHDHGQNIERHGWLRDGWWEEG
jgi:hypothetical protein